MKHFYLAFLFLCGAVCSASAQTASQYFFKYKTGVALENISSGATTLFGADADGVVSAALPFFPFTFAGQQYSSFAVSEDGVVVLGNATYTPYPYDNYFAQSPAIYGQSPAYPVLLPWGEDLFTGQTGSISYKVTGTAPARKLVIQYNIFSAEDGGTTAEYTTAVTKTFQVWLHEGSNQIQFVYGAIAYDWYASANIGVAASATDFLSVNSLTNTASATEVYSNSYGSFSPYNKGALPGNGASYIFSPMAIAEEPTAPPVAPISIAASMAPEYPVANQHKHTIYLGYGAQSVTLSAKATGGAPSAAGYTYSWSPATGLSNAAAAAPIAAPTVTTTYTVTVGDGNGNSATKTITVYVIDPRYGDKFYVCKLGKNTICISKSAVATQLNNGAALGECAVAMNPPSSTGGTGLEAARLVGMEEIKRSVSVSVYPNPSAGTFNIQLPEDMQQGSVTIFDANGKIVMQQKAAVNQQTMQLTLANKLPGVYLVKLTANGKTQTSKVIVK